LYFIDHKFIPNIAIAIELGGEDSNITYFKGGAEAFIEPLTALLETDASNLNRLSKVSKMIY
jgi:hypothetical protein